MVVQYWARHKPELKNAAEETERINELLPASRRGIRGVELKEYLAKRGFAVYVFDGELEDLRNHFDKGRPVIVCLASRERKRRSIMPWSSAWMSNRFG